jgi:hypothetical protein
MTRACVGHRFTQAQQKMQFFPVVVTWVSIVMALVGQTFAHVTQRMQSSFRVLGEIS